MKAYTDLEQSKKLLEILPLESADMCFANDGTSIKIDANSYNVRKLMWKDYVAEVIPCWSLASLFSVLPLECGMHKQTDDSLTYYYVEYPCKIKKKYLFSKRHDNLIDACYEMILKLNEQKLL
jgi:hypothetical protein